MSELPRRPNDHLVEPMFAALDHHRGDGESARVDPDATRAAARDHRLAADRERAGERDPAGVVPRRRAPSTARVLFWLAIVCAAGATVWITLAN